MLERRYVPGEEDDDYLPCIRYVGPEGSRDECADIASNLYSPYHVGRMIRVYAPRTGTGFLFDDWRLKLLNLILIAPGAVLLWGIKAYENGTIRVVPYGSEEEDG